MCALRRAPPLACVRWEQRERERMCGAAPAWRDLMWAGGCVCEGGGDRKQIEVFVSDFVREKRADCCCCTRQRRGGSY